MLEGSRLVAFVSVSNLDVARGFYRDTLGLKLTSEDSFALGFDVEGVLLRATLVADFNPQPFTVLGWQVADVRAIAKKLATGGVALERFSGLDQDNDGLWRSPGGALVGWFKDPDGNMLSITEFR